MLLVNTIEHPLNMTLVVTALTTTVTNAVGLARVGTASGINNAVSRAAGLLAIAVFSLVFNQAYDQHLTTLHQASTLRAALTSERSHLAAAQIPAGFPLVRHDRRSSRGLSQDERRSWVRAS